MMKQSKAERIRRLILIEGASDATIAKAVKCHVSYVWQVRKKLEKDIDTDTRVTMNMDAHSSGVQFDIPKSILDEAKDIIYGDREKTYGAPDKNLKAIAGYWANHLNTRFGVYHDISPEDVCIMMVLLKAARLGNDITHRDSQVDAVGYLALLERIQK
jgi:aspartate/methionine/tyrosine aminotransferase